MWQLTSRTGLKKTTCLRISITQSKSNKGVRRTTRSQTYASAPKSLVLSRQEKETKLNHRKRTWSTFTRTSIMALRTRAIKRSLSTWPDRLASHSRCSPSSTNQTFTTTIRSWKRLKRASLISRSSLPGKVATMSTTRATRAIGYSTYDLCLISWLSLISRGLGTQRAWQIYQSLIPHSWGSKALFICISRRSRTCRQLAQSFIRRWLHARLQTILV